MRILIEGVGFEYEPVKKKLGSWWISEESKPVKGQDGRDYPVSVRTVQFWKNTSPPTLDQSATINIKLGNGNSKELYYVAAGTTTRADISKSCSLEITHDNEF